MAHLTETANQANQAAIAHRGEEQSNSVRRRAAAVEPRCLRTFTPTLAVIERSAGCYHWTPEGRMLADFSSGVLVANLGHNPSRWWRRLIEYLGMWGFAGAGDFHAAAPLTAYNALTELEVRASERLVECLQDQPGGARCEQVLWAASGSEAIQKALWTALDRRPGADVILATRHGFHGKKGLAGATTGSESDPDRDERVRFIGFPREECIDVARRQQPLDLAPYAAELEDCRKQYGGRIACLITEPYLGGGGSYHPQKEYIQLLQRFCRENDAVFILDEVQANFGRTGSMFAFSEYGVEPDIVVLGKGLGNGVPVSAAVGRADLFAAMHYGEGSDTFSANPMAAAAVLSTLDEFAAKDVIGHARQLSAVIEHGLLRLTELPAVAHVRGEGVVWGIECAAVGPFSANQVAASAVEACYLGDHSGAAIHLLGPLAGKVLRVSPPLVMALDEARMYLEAMHGIFAALSERVQKGEGSPNLGHLPA
ncbi:MAG: aminotransferase class III-fold pyridoxal phosphate-dependent enzyme [Planctomycetia bacterium]|nr:aminotransferase class III-fold pyridoxal phosphate-dependent enzyme [Planctomycetia bacterium]